MNNLIDTHAHLFWDSFKEDFDQVVNRALKNGVTTMFIVGVDLPSSQKALKLVEDVLPKYSELTTYSTIGIHPHEVLPLMSLAKDKGLTFEQVLQENIDDLEKIYLSNPKKVIAVGECGLDFFFPSVIPAQAGIQKTDDTWIPDQVRDDKRELDQIKALQIKLLKAQIGLAKKLNLPLLIHCRDDRSQDQNNAECWDKVSELTKDHFGIYHCYSGLLPTTRYLLANTSFYFSFAANVTYPNAKLLREAAAEIPLDRILTETDCPFLPPQSKRGQRNEPANVLEVVKTIAEIKGITLEDIALQIDKNKTKLLESVAFKP